ncbi:flagellar protein FlaG [Paenibacillus polysaccharolyticus]|uniref:flagellar protein FlaG n=1 Tax=Paenibacillus polysaccharolyticus TaxID=582692 RepID=UPI00209E640E|nr:flagellar protein FlaG [Paenibacillus polysaccharolyticus]MCP1137453.1 flagellar protein FlaG [Paenibacillus polysaccharolyticus]
MNIQFSLSAATSASSSTVEITNQTGASQAGSEIANIRTAKEAYNKEKQGVKIPVGEELLIRNIDRAVKALQGPETTLDISIHEKTNDIMVKVLNKETGEVLREIPREQTLDLVAKMMEIAGILIDEKV